MSKSNRSTSDIHGSYPVEAAGRIKLFAEEGSGYADDGPWRSDQPNSGGDAR